MIKPIKVERGRHSVWALVGVILLFALICDLADAAQFRTGQESVTTGATEAIGTATDRVSLLIVNHDGANPIYCGDSAADSTTGVRVAAGAALLIDNKDGGQYAARQVVGCRATGGTVTASYLEQYNP